MRTSNLETTIPTPERTITDVPTDDRQTIRDHIEGAAALAAEHEIGFLTYLLGMASIEAHWSRDLRTTS